MRPSKYRKDKTPVFIEKLYKILIDQQNSSIISWTEDCNGFIIQDLNRFTSEVLPQYFKHSNYNSFVRQLNMYNFNKIRYSTEGNISDHVYQNKLFTKNNEQKFQQIRRKQTFLRAKSLVQDEDSLDQKGERPCQIVEKQLSLLQRLELVKQKQEKLQTICVQLINQNRLLLAQNQQLALKVRKESRKKEKILQQVFRIVGVSIAQFWDQFCQETETQEEKTNNFKHIYDILMGFIENNDVSYILKTLQLFISPKMKPKIFKVINPEQEANFLGTYQQKEAQQLFINQTNRILQQKNLIKVQK